MRHALGNVLFDEGIPKEGKLGETVHDPSVDIVQSFNPAESLIVKTSRRVFIGFEGRDFVTNLVKQGTGEVDIEEDADMASHTSGEGDIDGIAGTSIVELLPYVLKKSGVGEFILKTNLFSDFPEHIDLGLMHETCHVIQAVVVFGLGDGTVKIDMALGIGEHSLVEGADLIWGCGEAFKDNLCLVVDTCCNDHLDMVAEVLVVASVIAEALQHVSAAHPPGILSHDDFETLSVDGENLLIDLGQLGAIFLEFVRHRINEPLVV